MREATKERAAFAVWLAQQHLRFDDRLTEVIFLPTGAPDDQVRLLEINTGLYPEPNSPIEPIETTPAVSDLPFRVSIADVRPDEWAEIQAGQKKLPHGWKLEGRMVIKRKQ